jgi:hypothetical protein
MKLKKISNNQSVRSLLQLKLAKNKISTKSTIYIKTCLKIIFSYILRFKKILFIGTHKKIDLFYKFLFSSSNLIFMPSNLVQNGFFSNIFVSNESTQIKNKNCKLLLKSKLLNYDLIVSLSNNNINELLKYNKVPVLLFSNIKNTINSYCFSYNELVERENDVLYFLIYNIFKKYKVINKANI